MKHQLCIAVCGLFLSCAAFAQDYGLTLGVHQASASVDMNGNTTTAPLKIAGSSSGSLGYDVGLIVSFELLPNFRFRSGALYDYRPFEFKPDNGGSVSFKYAWLDVPVNVQYNFNPMVGVFGGLIVGINASDSYSNNTNGNWNANFGVQALYPLANLGVNFMFNDMIGIDLFYESGLGKFSDVAKGYSTFGMHFIYWL